MSPPAEDHSGMETRIALIEREFGIVHSIFQKFESALDKMSEASTLVQKLLAVHDQRIAERERVETALLEGVERRREEFAQHAERTTQKMEAMATELKKEIKTELSDLGETVKSSLKELKDSQQEIAKKIDDSASKKDVEKLDERVRDLERWRWLLVGGGAAVGFIIARWSFIASLFASVGS